jgi:hypothetical protein
MGTLPAKPPCAKARARTVRVDLTPSDVNPFFVLTVTERKSARTVIRDTYFVRELQSDLGRAFEVRKAGAAEPYHVLLAEDDRRCECKGFLAHGHCRHVEGLQALLAAGKLDAAEAAAA